MIHQSKITQKHFMSKIEGHKMWEIRLNDRNYSVGDYIGLNEIDDAGRYTGRFVVEKIVDIVYPADAPDGAIGAGYVILSTFACDIVSTEELLKDVGASVTAYGEYTREFLASLNLVGDSCYEQREAD